MEAIFLISSRNESKEEVVYELLEIPEVLNAYPVMGEYDIIAGVKTEDLEAFQRYLRHHIRGIDIMTMLIPNSIENEKIIEHPWLFH